MNEMPPFGSTAIGTVSLSYKFCDSFAVKTLLGY